MDTRKKYDGILVLIALATAFLLASCCTSQRTAEVLYTCRLDSAYAVIRGQLEIAQNRLAASKTTDSLILKEAVVTFDNVVSLEKGGSLGILVFKPQYTYTKKRETTVKFSLINNGLPKNMVAMMATPKPGEKYHLADLIYDAAQQFSAVGSTFWPENKTEKDFEVDIAFAVDQNYGIEIGGTLGVLTPGVKATSDVQTSNSVSVQFLMVKRK